MAIVCDKYRLEFLTQIVVVVEGFERNAVAISQVPDWDVLLLTLINRSRSSFSESSSQPSSSSPSPSPPPPSSSPTPSSSDDEKIVIRISHRIVAAVARAHLSVTCGWKIICGCLDLACRLVEGQPEKSNRESLPLSPGKGGARGHLDGLSFVLDSLTRQV